MEDLKVYAEDKVTILETYDLDKGYLYDDVETIHHESIPAKPYIEEVGHYETIREYSNGSKDVEWIVDVVGQEATPEIPAYDEYKVTRIYHQFTEEELKKRNEEIRLEELEKELSDTDYKLFKYLEGYYTEEEYAPIKAQREELRNQIRSIIDKEDNNDTN